MVASWILCRALLTENQRSAACQALGELLVTRRSKGFDVGAAIPGKEVCWLVFGSIAATLLIALADVEVALGLGLLASQPVIYVSLFMEGKLRRDVSVSAQAAISKMQVRESVDVLAGLWMSGYDRVRARNT